MGLYFVTEGVGTDSIWKNFEDVSLDMVAMLLRVYAVRTAIASTFDGVRLGCLWQYEYECEWKQQL